MARIKISEIVEASIVRFYGNIKKILEILNWKFGQKSLVVRKLIKIHNNVYSTLRNDKTSNHLHIEVVLLQKIIYV